MQIRADELVEQWCNGNRVMVVAEVLDGKDTAKAALLSALIFSQLDVNDRTLFLGWLNAAFNKR
jgi:hypothetical protein